MLFEQSYDHGMRYHQFRGSDSAQPRRASRRPRGIAVRLVPVNLAFLMFLLFWKPRYGSLAAAKRASRSPSTVMGEEKVMLKDDAARHNGRTARPPRRTRRHRRLVYSLMTVCAVSTLIILLSVISSPTITAWHPGGWLQF